jgi:site-specific DNA recombinase
MRAAQYLRVSMAEQLKGHSLDAQRTSTAALIRQREWTAAGEYVDAGISAKSDAHRPAFLQLLADAQQGRFDVVVVDKVDRFYRHLKGLLGALDTLRGAEVTFVSVQENLDFSTPWGKLTLTMLGMLAEIYLDNLSQETHKGKLARARKGQWNGAIPFGYCRGTCSTCTDPNGPDYCPDAGGPDHLTERRLYAHPVNPWPCSAPSPCTSPATTVMASWRKSSTPTPWNSPMAAASFRTKGLPGRFPPGPFSKDSVRELLQHRFYTGMVNYYGRMPRGASANGRMRQIPFPVNNQSWSARRTSSGRRPCANNSSGVPGNPVGAPRLSAFRPAAL